MLISHGTLRFRLAQKTLFLAQNFPKVMKKIIPMLAAVTLIGLVGCTQPNNAGMDDATRNRKMDSAYSAQRTALFEETTMACAQNLQQNVQMKTDSILAARGAQ